VFKSLFNKFGYYNSFPQNPCVYQENKKVLISCRAGISRSALLVLMVLADVMGMEDAMLKIMAERPIIEFHDNFIPLVEKIFKKG